MKKVARLFGWTIKTVKWGFIVFCIFTGSLFFREQRIPGKWVSGICERFAPEGFVFGCDAASFGFRGGLKFRNFAVYDRSCKDPLKPMFLAESIEIFPFSRCVRVTGADMPKLPDGYYAPREEKFAGGGEEKPCDFSQLKLPRIPEIRLELLRPSILGVAPERVETYVVCSPRKAEAKAFHLDWPDQDEKMFLDGFCTVDLDGGAIIGEVRGTATQEHIRPLLLALDLPVSYPYMGGYEWTGKSGFTEVAGPVPAVCNWKVDLVTKEFNLDLDLHPKMGRYNEVRLEKVDGGLGVHVYFTEKWMGYDITVGPLEAVDPAGRGFGGVMTVHGTNGLDYLEFDAHSELAKQDTLDIMGYLNRGTLDAFECIEPPKVTAKGIFNCNDVNIANNDFGGRLEVGRSRFLGFDLASAAFDYRIAGSGITFDRVVAKGEPCGDIRGRAEMHLPIADGDKEFSGSGHVEISNGKLARIPLFSVLTEALAENVPGIDKLVDQSEARCDFTISNGVFRTENLVVEGALFCIKLSGKCDLESDAIDFIAHCTVMKKESLLGKYLIQPILWPFTKLLTEFEVTGTAAKPMLRNTSVKKTGELIEKVLK